MNKKPVRYIYWFAYYNLGSPSVRYRAKYPLDYAKKNLGIENMLIIPGYSPSRMFRFIYAWFSALLFPEKGALIVIQRVHSKFIYSNLLKFLIRFSKVPTVYDLDDADYLEFNPHSIHYFAKHCTAVSAGSEEIRKYLSQFNNNVVHIGSPVPDLGLVKRAKNNLFTIGWVGGFGWGHRDTLYANVFPALKTLPFKCRLVLVGITKDADEKNVREYFANCPDVILEIPRDLDWNDEPALQNRLLDFDVGIATLLEHPIQLAKSGIKAKQYMNNGVPVLSTDLPENNNVVINGENGFLCNSPEEFREKIIHFHEMDSELFAKFISNTRKTVRQFHLDKYIGSFQRIGDENEENTI